MVQTYLSAIKKYFFSLFTLFLMLHFTMQLGAQQLYDTGPYSGGVLLGAKNKQWNHVGMYLTTVKNTNKDSSLLVIYFQFVYRLRYVSSKDSLILYFSDGTIEKLTNELNEWPPYVESYNNLGPFMPKTKNVIFANAYHFKPPITVWHKLQEGLLTKLVLKSAPNEINEKILKRYEIATPKNATRAMEGQNDWWIFESDFLGEKEQRKIKSLLK